MVVSSDSQQLELIKRSLVEPSLEDEAKRLLLKDLYRDVARYYTERAPNGGLLAPLPECVKGFAGGAGEPCRDDMAFTYNAIRVLLSRYVTRDQYGRPMETPSMVMARVARGFAGYVDAGRLYGLLVSGRFMFNSPTLFNMYSDGARGTLSACYVTPVHDDMRAIMDAASVQAMTFKWGGGQGFSFSELRPRWDVVKGTSGYASGPMSFMRIYDVVTEMVKQGGKRRGANMGIMHAWHPDIYNPGFDPWTALRNMLPPQVRSLIERVRELIDAVEREGYEVDHTLKQVVERLSREGWETIEDAGFIQAKEPPLHDANLTNFNISVGANDAFMEAVINDREWWMVNPRYSLDPETGVYKIHHTVSRATGLGRLGELIEKNPWLLENPYLAIYEDVLEEARASALKDASKAGYTPDQKNPYTWKIQASVLWENIVGNAWAGGDPGLFFPDNHNKWAPTPWLGAVYATNPCGEQPLYPFESCNLGSMSLEKYVDKEKGVFDLEKFMQDVQDAVDAMDAVIDLNNHPDPRQDVANKFTRKIGLGVMGLADALARLGLPYDSDEAVAFTLIAMAALEAFAWKRSWELGAKRGPAPAFNCKRFDWKGMKCLEKAEPEELIELHTPALVKAGLVARFEEGWLKVRYHTLTSIGEAYRRLVGLARERVEEDGSVKLVQLDVLETVARRVFGFTSETALEAASMHPALVANSPRHLVALAVFNPLASWEKLKAYGLLLGARAPRNTVATTVAPTGTISIIAGTSSGIEPYFALVYKRRVTVGEFLEVVREFRSRILSIAAKYRVSEDVLRLVYETISRHKGSIRWALDELEEKLASAGAPQGFVAELRELARLFPMSMDFDVWYHVAHQMAAQLYVDQAISKTINLRREAGRDEVYTAYLLAWLGGLKGVTVYRDESKSVQVIYFGGEERQFTGTILRRREKKNSGNGSSIRMTHLKRRLTPEEVQRDAKLRQLYTLKESETGEVVVELTENSTCTTCEL